MNRAATRSCTPGEPDSSASPGAADSRTSARRGLLAAYYSSCGAPKSADIASVGGPGEQVARARQRELPVPARRSTVGMRPYYNRPLAEIAASFDSVYVSSTRDLGAIAGAWCSSVDWSCIAAQR